jgi:superfamily II DNA or RNA helicase
MISYIYVRENKYWNIDNVCKIGFTTNIPDRNGQYITCEPIRGKFTHVFEFTGKKMGLQIEDKIHEIFNKYHFNGNGGIEFFNKDVIKLIEPYFVKNQIKYKKLTDHEINNLSRVKRNKIIKFGYEERLYQTEIINKTIQYLTNNDKGLLVLTCGVGKTIVSILVTKKMNMENILIGVPNTILLEQWVHVVKKILNYSILEVNGKTSPEKITTFLSSKNKKIMVTTYASSYKISEITQKNNIIFDMIILDEVHHVTSQNIEEAEEKKSFVKILNIESKKQIGLTATLKHVLKEKSISNKDVKYFGNIIEYRSLLWAINNNIICDYEIQTLICDNIDEILEYYLDNKNDKRLLFSVYCALESIKRGHSHHLLIYSNNIENSLRINKYLNMMQKRFNIDNLYYSNYVSEMTNEKQKDIINNFENAKYGIISCVYCLGEGWDFPLLDGVIFSENMSSTIRIVQSALRPCRKSKDEPNKINKIILPIINSDFTDNSNKDLQKVKEVIYQIGMEDETIIQKIKVFNISFSLGKKSESEMGETNEDLTDNLRLFTRKRLSIGITYNKAKKIISKYKNIFTKEDYYELCNKDYRLTTEPEILYHNKFLSWTDYFNIDKKRYYNIDECKSKCSHYIENKLVEISDILDYSEICNRLCKIDKKFPPDGLWTDIYGINDVSKIIVLSHKIKDKPYEFIKEI